MNSFDIHACEIKLPSFDEKGWMDDVEQESGLRREILRIKFNTLLLLKKINDKRASFERLAWMSIWAREMHLLDATMTAYEGESEFLVEILNRLTFEYQIHCYTIMFDPFRADILDKTSENKNREKEIINRKAITIERLRAYAAWCLWNDLMYLKEHLHPQTLKHAWDPEPARSIMSNPEKYAKYLKVFGEIDIETNEKALQEGLLNQQVLGLHNQHRLRAWLNHKDLIKWKKKLENMSKLNRQPASFFALLNESEKSIKRRLESMNMRWAYVLYKKDSLLIHGSSVQTNMIFHEKKFSPRSMTDQEAIQIAAKAICSGCMDIWIGLKLSQSALWNVTEEF